MKCMPMNLAGLLVKDASSETYGNRRCVRSNDFAGKNHLIEPGYDLLLDLQLLGGSFDCEIRLS